MKLLFWLALIVLVYWAVRDKNRRQQSAADGMEARPRAGKAPESIESMLQCRHCGVYFPASEAARNTLGDAFCSDEHRRAFGG